MIPFPVRLLGRVALVLIALFPTVSEGAADRVPKVVVSINPLHSLVASVMDGLASPVLLIRGAASPHGMTLKPSDAKALASADVIFLVGAGLETAVEEALKSLAPTATVVRMADAEGIALRAPRVSGGDHRHDHDHHHDDDGDKAVDPHLWLDPANAAAMARAAVAALSAKDPANERRYRENAAALEARLAKLDGDLDRTLSAVRALPYVVFHDAYGYFEGRYGLSGTGWVAVSPDRRPGARHLMELREDMARAGARCIFVEPQFPSRQADALAHDTGARLATLDPLGAEVTPGPGAYDAILRAMAKAFRDCLMAEE